MSLTEFLGQIGLPGLFALGLFDGEAAALLGGVLSHHGMFRPETAALTLAGAGAVSDNLLFGAGRLSSRVRRLGEALSRPALDHIRQSIARHPAGAVMTTRFAWGLHGLGTMALGASPISWLRFAALNAVSVLVWAHLWLWAGNLVLGYVHRLFGRLLPDLSVVLALVAGVVILAMVYRRRG